MNVFNKIFNVYFHNINSRADVMKDNIEYLIKDIQIVNGKIQSWTRPN